MSESTVVLDRHTLPHVGPSARYASRVGPPTISTVVPIFNEEAVLGLFVARLRPVLDGLRCGYEVVAIDDGSSDGTPVLLQRYLREWPQLRVIRLRANSGHQAAISAGLAAARGEYVVTLDADLQDPPEVLARMLEVARRDGVDVVYGVREDRSSDTVFKRATANLYYGLMRRISHTSAPRSAGDYRLMSRATVDAVNALPEQHRVLRLVVPALNFPSASVAYTRAERAAGSSKYTLGRMVRLALDSVTSFSTVPLRAATWLGLFGALCAFGVFLYALIGEAVGEAVAGWASLVGTIAGVGGVQLLCIGILGEYVGRVYVMLQRRPVYSVAYDSLAEPIEPFAQPAARSPVQPLVQQGGR